MVVMQDKRTTYDLGGNPTEIKFYDNDGWAYTETRTYARGYQLTDFSTSVAGDVTINTAGSYTYDTNNNLTGTKKFDASRSGSQLSYRAQWEFTFDNKNRLKTHENVSAADNVRGNIWYDGKGRVWQRWNDSSSTPEWDPTLKRFVYDGATLVQEHTVAASVPVDEWVYTYVDINRDYLRHPAGLRQRERSGGNDTDYYLQTDEAALEYKIERSQTSATADRTERSASLDQIAGGSFTSDLSNLATSGEYIEMYGDLSNGFDGLVQKRRRHFLSGLGGYITPQGNNRYRAPSGELPGVPVGGSGGGIGIPQPRKSFKIPRNIEPLSGILGDSRSAKQAQSPEESETPEMPVDWPCSEDCWENFWGYAECFARENSGTTNLGGAALYSYCCPNEDDICRTTLSLLDNCVGCVCLGDFHEDPEDEDSPTLDSSCLCPSLDLKNQAGHEIKLVDFIAARLGCLMEVCGDRGTTRFMDGVHAQSWPFLDCNDLLDLFPWPTCQDICLYGDETCNHAMRQCQLRCSALYRAPLSTEYITCSGCCTAFGNYCNEFIYLEHTECLY